MLLACNYTCNSTAILFSHINYPRIYHALGSKRRLTLQELSINYWLRKLEVAVGMFMPCMQMVHPFRVHVPCLLMFLTIAENYWHSSYSW